MKRMAQVSLFVLGSLGGALVGTLMSESSERLPIDARHLEDSETHRKLVTLTNEVTRLREVTERGDRSAVDAAEVDEDDDHEEPDYSELVARERERADRRAAVLAAAADREAVDSGWAPTVERQIADGLAAHGPPGVKLVSTICKTTLCIAEVEHPPGEDGTKHVNWLTVFGLSRGFFVRHEPESDTGARTVAYLARDGYPLPRAEPASAAGRER